jgi:type IV secretion system protein VirB3
MDAPESSEGLAADHLFVAATRPPTRWGVPYLALLLNMVLTMEIFIMGQNPLILLLALPIHGVCMLLCAHDARFFELALLWGQTRMPAIAANLLVWKGNSYSPLTLDVPDAKGRRRSTPTTYV